MNLYSPPAGTIRASLRYPAFRWLLSGLAVSQTGDWLYNLALVTMVYEGTHSAMWVGITTAARVVPLVALGPLGGVIADRFDRRRLMAACDGIRLVLMLVPPELHRERQLLDRTGKPRLEVKNFVANLHAEVGALHEVERPGHDTHVNALSGRPPLDVLHVAVQRRPGSAPRNSPDRVRRGHPRA